MSAAKANDAKAAPAPGASAAAAAGAGAGVGGDAKAAAANAPVAKSEHDVEVLLKKALEGVVAQGATLTHIALSGGVLTLAGKVPVPLGSELNMIVSDIVLAYPQFVKSVSRSGVQFVPRHKGTGQYELSPDDADLTEYYDDAPTLERKLSWAAARIKAAKHVVAYTGAGISTAAKIPDFRGPQGVWTRRDRGENAPSCIAMEQAIPTLAHRALVAMMNAGVLKYLVSQNVDGLHRRSGIPKDKMSELHGNCYIENCDTPGSGCGAEFLRHFDVCAHHGSYFAGVKDVASKSGISHITGRVCETCKKGMLRDSIIHFGENLPEQALARGIEQSKQSDVALIIGTSLRVTPAADLPQNVKRNGGPMICVNLQATGKDPTILSSGGIIVHAKCDAVMALLMTKLGVPFEDTTQLELEQEIARGKALAAKQDEQNKARAAADTKRKEQWAAKAAADAKAADAAAAELAKSAPPTHFFVCNSHARNPQRNEHNAHVWTLFVSTTDDGKRADAACARFIDRVDVKLHDTFDPRHVVLRPGDAPNGLSLTRTGWGTFVIHCTVHFVQGTAHGDRDPLVVQHMLVLDDDKPFSCTKAITPPAKAKVGLFAALTGAGKPKLKSVQTKVTTVTGDTYIEPKPPGGASAGGAAGSAGAAAASGAHA